MADQPTAESLHVNHFAGSKPRRKRQEDDEMDETIRKLENAVFKRDFTAEQRRKLASEHKALSDGSYPIETSADLKPAAVLARSGHGNVGAAKALIARRAEELGAADPLQSAANKSEFSFEVKLLKGDDFKGDVMGIVLEPDLEDSQGDVASAEEIEKAAHDFMRDYLQPDLQHSGRSAGAFLTENYCARADFTVETSDGPQLVRKGSWVQMYHVEDDVTKQEIADKKITGFSMEGTGVRTPIAA